MSNIVTYTVEVIGSSVTITRTSVNRSPKKVILDTMTSIEFMCEWNEFHLLAHMQTKDTSIEDAALFALCEKYCK